MYQLKTHFLNKSTNRIGSILHGCKNSDFLAIRQEIEAEAHPFNCPFIRSPDKKTNQRPVESFNLTYDASTWKCYSTQEFCGVPTSTPSRTMRCITPPAWSISCWLLKISFAFGLRDTPDTRLNAPHLWTAASNWSIQSWKILTLCLNWSNSEWPFILINCCKKKNTVNWVI